MALIECYECGKEISSIAAACPHCGAPANVPRLDTPPPSKGRIGPLKKLAVIVFWVIVGLLAYSLITKVSTDELSARVLTSMQETIDTDPDYSSYGLQFTELTVVKVQGNQYRGFATVFHEGKEHSVPVDITYDGEALMWNIEQGGLAFLAPAMFEESFKDVYKQFNDVMSTFQKDWKP
ncbi:hypothetical protein [Stutzerimonas stutzeri]|uniref:hypothetical protein n=1 Tax=Stutzerimonas stutzeri TaxID=316 RepID=UPI0033592B79